MYLNPMRCLGNYIDSKPDSEQYYQHLTCISLSGEGKKRKLIILICSKKWFAVRALGSVETLTVLLTKVHWVKAMFFLVVMYAYESWTIKKAECWRIDAFELWCWRRLLRVPWTARRSNQSILKKSVLNIHWKDWCWSWNSNTLATWCKDLTHLKRPWCWERLKGRGEGDYRGWDGWMSSLTQWTWVWASSRSWWWTGKAGVLQSMGSQRVRHNWVTELRRKNIRKIMNS